MYVCMHYYVLICNERKVTSKGESEMWIISHQVKMMHSNFKTFNSTRFRIRLKTILLANDGTDLGQEHLHFI